MFMGADSMASFGKRCIRLFSRSLTFAREPSAGTPFPGGL